MSPRRPEAAGGCCCRHRVHYQLSERQVAALGAAVQAAARSAPPLRRCALRFAADLMVLLAGARPLVMLDYAPGLRLQQLQAALAAALAAVAAAAAAAEGETATECGHCGGMRAAAAVPPCCVLTLDGCHHVASLPALADHLDALLVVGEDAQQGPQQQQQQEEAPTERAAADAVAVSAPAQQQGEAASASDSAVGAAAPGCSCCEHMQCGGSSSGGSSRRLRPLLVAFDPRPGNDSSRGSSSGGDGPGDGQQSSGMRLMGPQESMAVLAQLQPLRAAVQQLLAQAQGVPVINLAALPGLPLMPTLNGLLLAYPAVYVIRSMQEGQRAAALLSSHPLTLYTVRAACPRALLRVLPAAAGDGASGASKAAAAAAAAAGGGDSGDDLVLAACSLPGALVAGAEGVVSERVGAWAAGITDALRDSGAGWRVHGCTAVNVGLRAVSL